MEYVGHEFMRVFEEELIFGIKELHGQMQQPGGTVLYYLLKLSYSMGNLFMIMFVSIILILETEDWKIYFAVRDLVFINR